MSRIKSSALPMLNSEKFHFMQPHPMFTGTGPAKSDCANMGAPRQGLGRLLLVGTSMIQNIDVKIAVADMTKDRSEMRGQTVDIGRATRADTSQDWTKVHKHRCSSIAGPTTGAALQSRYRDGLSKAGSGSSVWVEKTNPLPRQSRLIPSICRRSSRTIASLPPNSRKSVGRFLNSVRCA